MWAIEKAKVRWLMMSPEERRVAAATLVSVMPLVVSYSPEVIKGVGKTMQRFALVLVILAIVLAGVLAGAQLGSDERDRQAMLLDAYATVQQEAGDE